MYRRFLFETPFTPVRRPHSEPGSSQFCYPAELLHLGVHEFCGYHAVTIIVRTLIVETWHIMMGHILPQSQSIFPPFGTQSLPAILQPQVFPPFRPPSLPARHMMYRPPHSSRHNFPCGGPSSPSAIYSSTACSVEISYVAQHAHTKLRCTQRNHTHTHHTTDYYTHYTI